MNIVTDLALAALSTLALIVVVALAALIVLWLAVLAVGVGHAMQAWKDDRRREARYADEWCRTHKAGQR